MERGQPEPVDERLQVVDQPLRLEAVGRVPARPAVAARIGEKQLERLGQGRDLGGE